MNKQYKQIQESQKGFSIIEVVLVLAIAGLIFLMVFIALPALQRGQRDTGRKNDISTVTSALQSYASNNRGSLSAITSAKIQAYVDRLSQYDVTDVALDTATGNLVATTDTIKIRVGKKCPTSIPAPGTLSATPATGSATRSAAVFTALENNGSSSGAQFFCQDL